MSDVTIYHNPACSTSRSTLALLRERGVEPRVVEYLKTPPGRDELKRLVALMGIPVAGCCAARKRCTASWAWTIRNGPTTS